jgi:hypothetical protein
VGHRCFSWLAFARETTDFGQIFGGAIGTMFALVFAMVTVAVWQNYDRVQNGVGDEANCIHNIFRYLESYPPEVRGGARTLLQAYLKEVIEVEWPLMKEGRRDPVAHRLITDLNARITSYRPTALGASLGIIFFIMLAYNHPFAGPAAITSEPFKYLLENHWTEAAQPPGE